jgi:hypothetical protein
MKGKVHKTDMSRKVRPPVDVDAAEREARAALVNKMLSAAEKYLIQVLRTANKAETSDADQMRLDALREAMVNIAKLID